MTLSAREFLEEAVDQIVEKYPSKFIELRDPRRYVCRPDIGPDFYDVGSLEYWTARVVDLGEMKVALSMGERPVFRGIQSCETDLVAVYVSPDSGRGSYRRMQTEIEERIKKSSGFNNSLVVVCNGQLYDTNDNPHDGLSSGFEQCGWMDRLRTKDRNYNERKVDELAAHIRMKMSGKALRQAPSEVVRPILERQREFYESLREAAGQPRI